MARVLVPLAQGCEELEAVTVIDLLRRAGVDVVTAGLDDQPVTASRGVRLIPDALLADVMEEDFDMIVLPGGLPGAEHLDQDERIHALLTSMSKSGRFTAAICAAPSPSLKACSRASTAAWTASGRSVTVRVTRTGLPTMSSWMRLSMPSVS